MKDNWVGAIMSLLFVCNFMVIIILVCSLVQLKKDYDGIFKMCQEATEKVEEHEKIMKAYQFFNWKYSLQMDTSDLEE